jgi:hypothetical protein
MAAVPTPLRGRRVGGRANQGEQQQGREGRVVTWVFACCISQQRAALWGGPDGCLMQV